MTHFNETIWSRAAYPLARWLARLGVTNSRLAWGLLFMLSPGLAGLTVFTQADSGAHNTFFWWWPGPAEEEGVLESLLADVSEMIEQAAAPGGLDTYWIKVDRLAALASDQNGVDGDQVDATLHQRKVVARRCLKGDRYYDWKKGAGKARACELLAWACPTADLPVTVVKITMNGDVVARMVRRWHFGRVVGNADSRLPSALCLKVRCCCTNACPAVAQRENSVVKRRAGFGYWLYGLLAPHAV